MIDDPNYDPNCYWSNPEYNHNHVFSTLITMTIPTIQKIDLILIVKNGVQEADNQYIRTNQ